MTRAEWWFVFKWLLVTICFATFLVVKAQAHEDKDEDGNTTVFDGWCCTGADCKRVRDEDLVNGPQPGTIIHVPSGKVFDKDSYRISTNKHQYACIYQGQARCLYLRGGA